MYNQHKIRIIPLKDDIIDGPLTFLLFFEGKIGHNFLPILLWVKTYCHKKDVN